MPKKVDKGDVLDVSAVEASVKHSSDKLDLTKPNVNIQELGEVILSIPDEQPESTPSLQIPSKRKQNNPSKDDADDKDTERRNRRRQEAYG